MAIISGSVGIGLKHMPTNMFESGRSLNDLVAILWHWSYNDLQCLSYFAIDLSNIPTGFTVAWLAAQQ
jgi:hypothetical protein